MPMGYANQCGFTTTKCSQKICAHRSSLKTGNGGRKRPDCEGASGGTGAKPGLAPENGPKGSKKEEDRLKGLLLAFWRQFSGAFAVSFRETNHKFGC